MGGRSRVGNVQDEPAPVTGVGLTATAAAPPPRTPTEPSVKKESSGMSPHRGVTTTWAVRGGALSKTGQEGERCFRPNFPPQLAESVPKRQGGLEPEGHHDPIKKVASARCRRPTILLVLANSCSQRICRERISCIGSRMQQSPSGRPMRISGAPQRAMDKVSAFRMMDRPSKASLETSAARMSFNFCPVAGLREHN